MDSEAIQLTDEEVFTAVLLETGPPPAGRHPLFVIRTDPKYYLYKVGILIALTKFKVTHPDLTVADYIAWRGRQ